MRASLVLLTVLCCTLLAPASGAGQTTPERLVTFVARQCSAYSDIAANRARNDIQESLQDLGVDSAYAGGTPVAPAVEDAQNARCTPLPGWSFRLGTGSRRTPTSDPGARCRRSPARSPSRRS